MRWVGHVESMQEISNACKILVVKPDGRVLSEDLGVGGRITLKRFLGKSGLGVFTGVMQCW
jgi:hypothetical protein